TGIRAMHDAMKRANLTRPLLYSDREKNNFRVILYLVNFLQAIDLKWLESLDTKPTSDEQAWILVVTRDQGEIRNQDVRSLCGYDIVEASRLLKSLRDDSLLEQQGAGSATFYTLSEHALQSWATLMGTEEFEEGNEQLSLGSNEESLGSNESWYPSPHDQGQARKLLGSRASDEKWKKALSILLKGGGLSRGQLSMLTSREERQLREVLRRLVAAGFIAQTRPETPNDPHQAYRLL
ncbi:MAG: hypothetical protein WC423_14110, partial [Vulcanimicrobiota bacterium]